MTEERKRLIEALGLEPQRCFPCSDGSICCNYTIRGLRVIRPKKADGWIHFRPRITMWKKADKKKKKTSVIAEVSNVRKDLN